MYVFECQMLCVHDYCILCARATLGGDLVMTMIIVHNAAHVHNTIVYVCVCMCVDVCIVHTCITYMCMYYIA